MLLGDRVDATRGNRVPREGAADPDVVHVVVRGGVVNGDRCPSPVHRSSRNRRAAFRRGTERSLRARRAFAVALVVEQEEALVAPVVELGNIDGAVHLKAELVQVVVVLGQALGVVLERIGVQPLAPRELVDRAVRRVGAALQRHVDDAAAGLAVLRVIGVGLDLELLHRIDRRHVGDVVAARLRVIGRAVQQELVIGCAAAVDAPVGDGAVVERPLPNGLRR